MDTQKVETRALSDDQLDAVSGGASDNKFKEQENYEQLQAMKTFAQALEGQI